MIVRTNKEGAAGGVSTAGLALLVALVVGSVGCLDATSEATFIGGRDEDLCEGVFHQCKGQTAGCLLDEQHYFTGTFPGERKVLVETTQGDWKIRVLLFLAERLSPGTETEVRWYEPGCTDEYKYQLSKDKLAGDLFEQAGRDQVFTVEHPVIEAGDHLVSVWSDAVCRFDLRIEIRKQD
jgi:hypothetical protein